MFLSIRLELSKLFLYFAVICLPQGMMRESLQSGLGIAAQLMEENLANG